MTTEQQHDNQKNTSLSSPGQLLRAAREQRGWTREQVASRIHLRQTMIEAIETDTYDKHTSPTYIRGYLRTYAKLLGIPEETILAAFERLGLAAASKIDMQSFSRRSRQQTSDKRLKWVTWLVILALLGLSVAWWWQSSSRRSASDDALAATELSAAPQVELVTPTAVPAESAPVVSNETAQVQVAGVSSAVATDANALNSVSSAPASAVSSAVSVASSTAISSPQIKLSFTADCWLEIRDGNRKVLFSGLKKANDELVLEGAEPIKFVIGAPMAAKLEYKGEAFDMSRYNKGRTARFTLPKE